MKFYNINNHTISYSLLPPLVLYHFFRSPAFFCFSLLFLLLFCFYILFLPPLFCLNSSSSLSNISFVKFFLSLLLHHSCFLPFNSFLSLSFLFFLLYHLLPNSSFAYQFLFTRSFINSSSFLYQFFLVFQFRLFQFFSSPYSVIFFRHSPFSPPLLSHSLFFIFLSSFIIFL